MPMSQRIKSATGTPPQHNSLRPLTQRLPASASLQTATVPPEVMSPLPSPSQEMSPVSLLMTSPLPAAASKTAPSPVQATPTRSLLPQQTTRKKAPSPLMSMPGSPPMPPATATPPQHNSARLLTQRLQASASLQTPAAPPCHLTFSFSEDVSGFTADHITVTGGTKQDSSFSGSGNTYSIVVSPTGATQTGTITVDVDAGVATDSAGNTNIAATQFTQAFDTQAPSLSISSDTSGTATGPVTYNFSFSEDVSGFTAENITVTGGTKQEGSFSGSGDTYSIVVNPTDDTQKGTITVDVDAGVATDAAGNSNTAATQFTQAFDTPSLSITSDSDGSAGGDVTFTFSFSRRCLRFHR